jgi:hypothetical protein
MTPHQSGHDVLARRPHPHDSSHHTKAADDPSDHPDLAIPVTQIIAAIEERWPQLPLHLEDPAQRRSALELAQLAVGQCRPHADAEAEGAVIRWRFEPNERPLAGAVHAKLPRPSLSTGCHPGSPKRDPASRA